MKWRKHLHFRIRRANEGTVLHIHGTGGAEAVFFAHSSAVFVGAVLRCHFRCLLFLVVEFLSFLILHNNFNRFLIQLIVECFV